MNDKKIKRYASTMRGVLNHLMRELGTAEGKSVFEWYCKNYNLDIASETTAHIRYEVFGF